MKYILLTILLFSFNSFGWETDQFTRSDSALADIGPELSTYVLEHLKSGIQNVNELKRVLPAQVKKKKRKLEELTNKKNHFGDQNEIAITKRKIRSIRRSITELELKFDSLFTADGVAEIISSSIGRNVAIEEKEDAIFGNPTSFTPYKDGLKNNQKISFSPDKLGSVYSFAGFHRGLHCQYFILSSTIKAHGVEFGMDKLGHFFNEGLKYFRIYRKNILLGYSVNEAKAMAYEWGANSEDSYFGMLVSGIYSNADLAANYAGMHFYINLFEEIELNSKNYKSVLKRDGNGNYFIDDTQDLFKKYVSNHFNEVYNPSKIEYLQRVVIEKALPSRCASWERFISLNDLLQKKRGLNQWNGELYGATYESSVQLEKICYFNN